MIYGCERLYKSYGAHRVLENLTLSFPSGNRYCIMSPSGGGKTTLFRLFSGLEVPDGGRLIGFDTARISMVFQEDRLCDHLSPITNTALVQTRPNRGDIHAYLTELLPESCLYQPVSALSGGMKRRVAIARALLADSDVLLLDEPFTGLDEESRSRTIDFVRSHQGGRLLLMATHHPEEAEQLGAEILHL